MAQTSEAIVKIPRILIAGGSGEGKSSLVNLLSNENKATVSSGARGCTCECQDFRIRYLDSDYLLTDTVGFNEPDVGGAIPHKEAIKCLIKFAKDHSEGFNLIVFVMKKGRITQSFRSTYDFFYEVLFSEGIPCILYISGGEADDDMDKWYINNKQAFEYKFKFCEVISGTALDHKNAQLAELFRPKREETYRKLWEAIMFATLREPMSLKTEISFWLNAFNFIYYYFSFGGTMFKPKVKVDLEKQLHTMGFEEKTIIEIMALIH